MLFSQRNKHISLPQNLKADEISDELRNSLWNEITEWKDKKDLKNLCYLIWKNFFNLPTDKMPYSASYSDVSYQKAWEAVRQFYFSCHWHQIYSFIEFLFQYDAYPDLSKKIDLVLKKQLAVYRIVGNQFILTSDENEISALKEGISYTGCYLPISQHIQSSLDFLSNRESPNYRNSMKEAISAVEAACKIIAKKPDATLAETLKVIEKKNNLHPALKSAYSSLYGYTNDSDGIRHALTDKSNLTQADAKFFLLVCTSFVNYLITICGE